MDVGILASIFNFILLLVQIYYWGMIIYFFTSWVPTIRESNGSFLSKIYEPFLEPFRKIIPPIGMIDISSIVALFVLVLFQYGLKSIFDMILNYLILK